MNKKFIVFSLVALAVVGGLFFGNINKTEAQAASSKFEGGSLAVVNASNLSVRSLPGVTSALLGMKNSGDWGTVIDGPRVGDGNNANENFWWKIKWNDGLIGWSVENYLFEPPSKPKVIFSPGTHVGITMNGLEVREQPSLTGKILEKRWVADGGGNIVGDSKYADGYWWWKIDYDYGSDGWSVGNWLRDASSPNAPPVISEVIGPTVVASGQTITWRVVASDPEGDPLDYEAEWTEKDGTRVGTPLSTNGIVKLPFGFSATGTYAVDLNVFDFHRYVGLPGFTVKKTVTVAVSDDASVNTTFRKGDRVWENREQYGFGWRVYLSKTPYGLAAGTVDGNDIGAIIDGPQRGGPFWWWKVSYESGVSGWAEEDRIEKVGSGDMMAPTSTSTSTSPVSNRFSMGDNVAVVVSDLQVRENPPAMIDETSLRRKNSGDLGLIIEGPISSAGYIWWKIKWSDGFEGWSAEGAKDRNLVYLRKAGPLSLFSYAIGDKIRVREGVRNLNVRLTQNSASKFLAVKNAGDLGVITSGPSVDPDNNVWSAGFIFWKVKWDDGVEGWVAGGDQHDGTELFLEKVGSGDIITTPTSTPTSTTPTSTPATNKPPVIYDIDGPKGLVTLNAGTVGTWKISASDPDGDPILYSVDWNDGVRSPVQNSPTFAHTYQSQGIYNAYFEANDSKGGVSGSGVSIKVVLPGGGTPPTSTRFTTGDKIQTTGKVQVRTTAGGALLTPRAIGDKGTVIGGPEYAEASGVGYWWWNVNYDTGSDGWSAEDWLVKIDSTSTPTSTPPINNPPLISRITSPQSLIAGTAGIWTVVASDPNSDRLSYSAVWGDGTTSQPQDGSSFIHTFLTPRTYTIKFTVSDGRGWSVDEVVTAVVSNPSSILSTKFITGDKVRTTGNSQVRPTPTGAILTYRSWGDSGTIIGGPTYADGYWWWKVDYDTGSDGWSAEDWLSKLITSTKFTAGDKIKTTGQSQVKPTPDGVTFEYRKVGDTGVVIGGPTYAGPYWWWNINYDSGSDGWSAEDWLVKVPSAPTSTLPTNQPPVISSVNSPASVTTGVAGTWAVSASDPNGDALSYMAVWGDGQTSPWQSGSSFAHTYSNAGTYTATFTVGDGKGGGANKTATVTVTGVATTLTNQPPVIYSVNGPTSLAPGVTGNWNVSASDPNGDFMTYRVDWGDGTAGGSQNVPGFAHAYVSASTYIATFTVVDNKAAGTSKAVTVVVGSGTTNAPTSTPANQPPIITSVTPPASVTTGVAGTWTVVASDPDGNPLMYSVNWGDGSTSLVQDNSTFTHTYTSTGSYTATFTVGDGKGGSANKTATVTVIGATTTPTNQSPVISSVNSPTNLIAGTAGTWTVVASDPDNDALSYSVTWGDGQTSPAQSGTNFTHTYTTAGFYNITFTVADGKGGSATKALTVTAGSANLPTLSDITGPASLKINARGDWDVAISNPGGYSLSYVMDWGDGTKDSGSAGTAGYGRWGFNHTYKTAKTYTMTFTVTKDTGESVSKSLIVTATLAMAPSPASYTASAIQSIQLQLNQVVEQLRLILEQLR